MSDRLKLEVSQDKTRVINAKRRYSEFLGFKIKVWKKAEKYVVMSRICDKQQSHVKKKLVEQAKNVARPRNGNTELYEIKLYDSMVIGVQNYYRIATHIVKDCDKTNRAVMTIFTNRLRTQVGHRLAKTGRNLRDIERKRYGKSKTLRYVAGTGEPIYPIGYVRHKNPMSKKKSVCQYTQEGRKTIHDNLRINMVLMQKLMRQSLHGRSAEYADNRISLFSAQWGKCAVTGKDFLTLDDIHCHHKVARKQGGDDKYDNLTLVLEPIHKLIHATQAETIEKYKGILTLSKPQLKKINVLRQCLNLCPII